MPITVRVALAPDAEHVAELVHRAFRGDSSRAGWTTEADLLDGQRIDLAGVTAKIGHLLVGVDDDGKIVACCELERRPESAYFGMLAVEPTMQGTGVGRVMLEAAEAMAGTWVVPTVEMTVIAQRTELIEWYERRGYARTGEARPFPYGDEAFGVPRTDDLAFVVLAKQL